MVFVIRLCYRVIVCDDIVLLGDGVCDKNVLQGGG